LNNLIGHISWHPYFYFWALVVFAFQKDSIFVLKSFSVSFLKVIRLKPWFEFEYSKLILNSSRLEKSSKSSFEFIPIWPQFKFSLKIFESFDFEPKTLLKNWKNCFCRPSYSILQFGPMALAARLNFSLEFPEGSPVWPVPGSSPTSRSPEPSSSAGAATPCTVTIGRPPVLGGKGNKAPFMPPPFPTSNGARPTPLPLLFGFKTDGIEIPPRRRPPVLSTRHPGL
jgi:hypothetical protein